MVIEGVQAGEIAPVDIRAVDELLYGFLETAIFRLTVLGKENADELKPPMILAIRMLAARSPGESPQ
jgi:hypothetical protein